MKWTEADIPAQEGRMIIVTGANSGLGYYTALALAGKGARVIMACRSLERGEEARQKVLATQPDHEPELRELDLSSIVSVRSFAEGIRTTYGALDVLINNAGVMAVPYKKTSEGFEMQFGVNHLGHFALTALLWPILSENKGARIVNVSSLAHKTGKIRFEDIHWEESYKKWGAYGMSKLANLLFTFELNRLNTNGDVLVASAHPGYADTSLVAKGLLMNASKGSLGLMDRINKTLGQSGEMGALPSLFAASNPGVEPGAYYGPSGFMRMRGWPAIENPDPNRVTPEAAAKLWELSQELTGIHFPIS